MTIDYNQIYAIVFCYSGHCLLFATGNWQEDDGLFNVLWPSQGFCNYPIVISVFLFLVSFIQIYRYIANYSKDSNHND